MRAKKAFKNTVWGLVYEVVMLVCGFILPRLILTSFGSKYNGVTSAITQFLQVIALFQAGIGGVTIAALYKPLNEKNIERISIIVKTSESFLRKVVLIFAGVSLLVACGYPFLVSKDFDWFFTASLVIIISFSTFAQYFFGQTYQFLLKADQLQSVLHIVNSLKVIASTGISALMIYMGFGIREVKLGSAVAFIIAPLFLYFYTRKKFKILPHVKKDYTILKQRWDNFGTQTANFVTRNTDLVILSIFSNVYEISVYSIYNMITNGIFAMFSPFVNGVAAAFGSMIAKDEHELLHKNLRLYEQLVFMLATFLFGVSAAAILSFVKIYVKGVTDVNYIRPVFAYVFIISTFFQSVRYPYVGITQAAGHFRPMRNPAFIEAGINIGLSVVLVFKFGIVGVIIGTLFAYVYRTVRYAIYLSQNIIQRSIMIFVKRVMLSLVCILIIVVISHFLPLPSAKNYFIWGGNVVIISTVALILTLTVELLFYRDDLKDITKMAKGILRKRRQTNSF